MGTNRFIYFFAIIIVVAFSWWFYSLFELSKSNYESDKTLLEVKYREALKQYYHHAYKGDFKSDSGLVLILSGKEANIDTAKVSRYFKTYLQDVPIRINIK